MPSDQSKPVVVVTGCSGLIGAKLCSALAPDYQVIGLDIKQRDESPARMRFVECDFTKAASVKRAVREIRESSGASIASVVHLAAHYDFSGEPSSLYQELTVKGTLRLLSALEACEVQQFLFTSTLLVMKPSSDGEPINENSETEASWAYPDSKLQTEALLERERGKMPVAILRVAGVYDHLGRSPAITEHIKRIHAKDFTSYFFPGSKEHGQAFVHIDDLISMMLRTIEQRANLQPYEIFLVAEPEAVSYARFQDAIGEKIHGRSWPTLRVPKPVAKLGAWVQDKVSGDDEEPFIKPFMVDLADAHYPVDISKAKRLLGWSPQHRLGAELTHIVQHMLRDPAEWYAENDLAPPESLESEQAS